MYVHIILWMSYQLVYNFFIPKGSDMVCGDVGK